MAKPLDIHDLAKVMNTTPRMARLKLRAAQVKKVEGRYSWPDTTALKKVVSQLSALKGGPKEDWSRLSKLKVRRSFLVPMARSLKLSGIYNWGERHGVKFTTHRTKDRKHYRVTRVA
jgi:hypothetical protein